MQLPVDGIALGIVDEGLFVGSVVLERFAQRELEMQPILARQIRPLQGGAHGELVGLGEAECLQVGETPISFAQRRLHRYRTPVGADAVFLAPRGLQRVSVTHPDLRLARVLAQHALVDLDRTRVFAHVRQDRRLEVQVAGIARLLGEQPLRLGKRQPRLRLAIEHDGIVVARGIETWGELETSLEQLLGVRIAAQPPRYFGEHAQRRDIRREGGEMRPQSCVGEGKIVLDQRRASLPQPRVLSGGL